MSNFVNLLTVDWAGMCKTTALITEKGDENFLFLDSVLYREVRGMHVLRLCKIPYFCL